MKNRARFDPYSGSDRRVRFYIERPSGYMREYRLRDAMRDVRVALAVHGTRDPLCVSLLGHKPLRLPVILGPMTPRKTRCLGTRKDGEACAAMTWNADSRCRAHQPKPYRCHGVRADGERCATMLNDPGVCVGHRGRPYQCSGTTKEGERCTVRMSTPDRNCHTHREQPVGDTTPGSIAR